jgi:hypothetical protein
MVNQQKPAADSGSHGVNGNVNRRMLGIARLNAAALVAQHWTLDAADKNEIRFHGSPGPSSKSGSFDNSARSLPLSRKNYETLQINSSGTTSGFPFGG